MKYKINNQYIFAFIIKVLIIFVNLIESVFLARYLGTYLKGEISYISSVSQILFLIGTLGLNATYPYFKKKYGKENILNTIMSLNIILFIIYSVISIFLSFFINNIEYKYIIWLIPLLSYNYNIVYVYSVENPNKKNIIIVLLTLIKILYLLFLNLFIKRTLFWGVTTLILIPLIENIIFTKELKFKFSVEYINLKNIYKLIKISYISLICNLLTVANYKIDIIMLKNYKNISLSDVGIYSVGIVLAEKVFIVGDAVKEVLLSELSNGLSKKRVSTIIRISFTFTLLLSVCISIFSKLIINILYGNDYVAAALITNISIWGALFMIFFKLISQYNVTYGKQKINNIFLSITLLTNIILNIILLPKLGIVGVAIATSVGYLFNALLFIIYFHKETKIKYKDMLLIQKDDIKVIIDIFRRDYEK